MKTQPSSQERDYQHGAAGSARRVCAPYGNRTQWKDSQGAKPNKRPSSHGLAQRAPGDFRALGGHGMGEAITGLSRGATMPA